MTGKHQVSVRKKRNLIPKIDGNERRQTNAVRRTPAYVHVIEGRQVTAAWKNIDGRRAQLRNKRELSQTANFRLIKKKIVLKKCFKQYFVHVM